MVWASPRDFLPDRVFGLPLLVRLPRFDQPRVERNVHIREFNQVFPDGLRFAHPAPTEPSVHFVSELLDYGTRPFRVSFPFRRVLLHATHHNRRLNELRGESRGQGKTGDRRVCPELLGSEIR